MKLNETMVKASEEQKERLLTKMQKECKKINTLERLEQYYIDKGFKTYYAINNKNSRQHLLIFHPDCKDSKIFIVHTDDHKMFVLAVLRSKMITKHQELHAMMCAIMFWKNSRKNETSGYVGGKDRFDLGFDSDIRNYYCPSFKLFFERSRKRCNGFYTKERV